MERGLGFSIGGVGQALWILLSSVSSWYPQDRQGSTYTPSPLLGADRATQAPPWLSPELDPFEVPAGLF